MNKHPVSQSVFVRSRFLLAFALSIFGALFALGAGATYTGPVMLKGTEARPVLNRAEKVPFAASMGHDMDLRDLPYIQSRGEIEETRHLRHKLSKTASTVPNDPVMTVRHSAAAILAIPSPITSFEGMSVVQSGCGCLPPDTHGDVGPNHYVQSVNSSIKIFDKNGNQLNGATGISYDSFFAPLGASTPCGASQNGGDGFVLYDHLANRWVVTDFAFPANGATNYQCIGVSKTADPVSGGWWLYAVQVDPSNPTWLGDYPKFGLWPDGYYFSVNLFDANDDFQGVRVYALPRANMLNGTGAPNAGAIAFTVTPATLGDTYSLVPATFRTGTAPPAGRPEYFMGINSPTAAGVVQNQVYTWRFHADFATPGNSTFGFGANHSPDGLTTVANFVDAFTSSSTTLVPQTGTTTTLDTLGDKLMTPLVYQNLNGVESIWASHTINNNQNGTGPTAIRWYQFNFTNNVIPATPAQQQTFNNGGDGLWRFMPSLAVDAFGNMALNYSVSSSSMNPAIRYAGRLAGDPPNTLAQGEGTLIQGNGHQVGGGGRWGDYSAMSIDPSDNVSFWMANEYYASGAGTSWNTRIGKFKFVNLPVVVSDALTLTAENFSPANSAADPGETVTVNLTLQNSGSAATSNLVATLQASGGVTNPSGAQTYGVIPTNGGKVTKPFTFTANGSCGGTLTLTLTLQDGASTLPSVTFSMPLGVTNSATQTFSNSAAITIPAAPGDGATTGAPSNPYPSTITVSGVPVGFTKMTVKFLNMNHTFPDDVDVLLVSPTGRKMIVLSDTSASNAWSGTAITLDDDAAAILTDTGASPSGTYKPANYGTVQDPFPAPAPASPYLTPVSGGSDTLTSAFVGQNPNGVWSLYVVDDAAGDSGSFGGGWQLSFTTTTTQCVSTSAPIITNGPPPSPVIVGSFYSFAYSATGNPPPTFSLTGNTPPPGLGLSSAGVLSGTATDGGTGTYSGITVVASNGIAPDATQTITLNTATRAANYIASFGLTGPNAILTFDYEGDGSSNLLEYGLHMNPTVASLTGLPVVTLKNYNGTIYLSMTFNRSALATDLTYIVQGSSDLINWTDLGTSSAGAVTSGPGFVTETGSAPNFQVEVRDTVPDDGNPLTKRYLRLKITAP